MTAARRAQLALAGALGALLVMLLPGRVTPLRGDDVFSFQLQGREALGAESVLHVIWQGVTGSLEAGRPQPLGSVWGNLVIVAFDTNRVAYKVFLVLLTVACGALLWLLVRRLGGSVAVATMVVLLVGGAVQLRAYHDPMLGYYGTTQAALACLLGSLLLLLRGRTVWAVVVFGGSVLLYEVMAPAAIVAIALALHERRPRAAVPFALVAVGFVAYGFLARALGAGDAGGGYAVSYAPGAIISTYLEQLVPPLPGANVLLGDQSLFARPTLPELVGAAWRAALVGAVVLFAGWRRPALRALPAALVGALLIASPVLLIAFAEKYQRELSPATGYLPVIVQTFGWALLAGALVVAVARRSRVGLVALAVVLAAGAGLSGYGSLRVAATEVPRAVVTDAVHRAAERGVLAGLPERSAVVFVENDLGSGATGWGESHAMDAMLRRESGRRYDARHHPGSGMGTCEASPGPGVPLDCTPLSDRGAWMRMGASRDQVVVTVAAFRGPAFGTPATEVRAYVEGNAGAPPALTANAGGWTSAGQPWTRIASGGGWALYRLVPPAPAPIAESLVDAVRTIDVAAVVPGPDRVREMGTARVLP